MQRILGPSVLIFALTPLSISAAYSSVIAPTLISAVRSVASLRDESKTLPFFVCVLVVVSGPLIDWCASIYHSIA